MQIPKFQNPAKPLYPWKPSEQQEAVNKFVDSKLNEVKQIVKTADKRNSRLREADKRANRNVKIPYKLNNTAKLQEALYNVGAYNDMRNRKGISLSYEQAVDGIHGKMTDSAIAKAREMGYDVDVNSGTVTKRQENKFSNTSRQQKPQGRIVTSNPVFNTLYDIVGAGINRLLKPLDIQVPQYTQTENNISPDDMIFLQEAARRAEQDVQEFKIPGGRKAYFETHPNDTISYHFVGKTDNEYHEQQPHRRNQSGYEKFFGTPYGGVMTYGVSKALGKPNARAQNTYGGFTINYTKDHPFITDDWGYHSGAHDWSTLGGAIKGIGEMLGTERGKEPVVITTHANLPGYLEDERYAGKNFMDDQSIQ